MRIKDKIKRPRRPVVVYEILSPREKDGTLNSYAENISSLLAQTHIDAINIPEVRDESGRGERPVKNQLRAEPREFGKLLQDIVGIESIVNRVVVHQTLEKEMVWFEETYNKYEIENLITVGGESRNITYPGPSVNEALEAIKQNLTLDVLCGGISIPSREKESRKLIEKSKNGSEFFTTQVLYDSSKIIKMISHYQKRCDEQNTFPRRLLLSFAPVSSKKNIKFLKWLGVDIPTDTEKYLNENDQIMTERSMEIAINVLNETLTFLNENKIVVPIGLNVEHIMSYNFQASIEMLQELARIYREFCIKTDIY
ncbi:MAG: methylenetetrahydrofolate reductase [Candidatus Neomarinimicrobiota bacterium]|nr:methylenetetrahydrofolate reductase [Candidatus Neomarinimicrobiota bacterium]|tara:strand:- start:133 stop:1068 length:936 start_codon:yes stop_codon:yes gene_type:complete